MSAPATRPAIRWTRRAHRLASTALAVTCAAAWAALVAWIVGQLI